VLPNFHQLNKNIETKQKKNTNQPTKPLHAFPDQQSTFAITNPLQFCPDEEASQTLQSSLSTAAKETTLEQKKKTQPQIK
jgi:hypothetical protein